MEYCLCNHTFRTLGDLLTHYGDNLPVEHRIMALCDIAEGLQYLHSNGLVHGDTKPHNILVAGSEEELLFKIHKQQSADSAVPCGRPQVSRPQHSLKVNSS